EAHTLVAGDDGLDVLVFGEGSRTSLTHLPRAGVMWVAPHWVPPDGPHPFEAEIAAGPLELPAPEAQRPPTIAAVADVLAVDVQRGATNLRKRAIGDAVGSVRTGASHQRIAPGARGWPRHCHTAEEELFVVLSGAGEVLLGDERFALRAGSVIARPPGTGVAHAFEAGDAGLELLGFSTRCAGDAVFYPDSSKVSLRGLGPLRFRVDPVDYWDGEE
ncbi:MAG TPA: cupin domain-containing protein, partial [Baekduia sp.]|nr:cupin domain-containing protein [Baekduia sp.]